MFEAVLNLFACMRFAIRLEKVRGVGCADSALLIYRVARRGLSNLVDIDLDSLTREQKVVLDAALISLHRLELKYRPARATFMAQPIAAAA